MEATLNLSGPGILYVASQPPYLLFTFPTEVVINALVLTTLKDRALKKFQLRANTDPNRPFDLQTWPTIRNLKTEYLHMFESEEYKGSNNTLTRVFRLPRPLATTRVKLDKMEGSPGMAFRLEFLGIDTKTKHSIQHPFKGGSVFSSK